MSARNILIGFFILLSLTKVVGKLSDTKRLKDVGYALGFTPAPSPFRTFTWPQKIKHIYSVAFEKNGQWVWQKITYKDRENLGGTHRRKIPYFVHFYKAHQVNPTRMKNILKYAFCNNGPFAQTMKLPQNLKRIQFLQGEIDKNHTLYKVECQ